MKERYEQEEAARWARYAASWAKSATQRVEHGDNWRFVSYDAAQAGDAYRIAMEWYDQ